MQDNTLTLFPDLPEPKSRRPLEPIVRTALLTPPYRPWLKRAWGAGPQIAWAMLNPSTADGLVDDPTMWRVMEFSLRWGFGSCVVVNIYPFQSPMPAEMKKWRAKVLMKEPGTNPETEAWFDNVEHCARELSMASRRVAAWGNNADPEDVSWWLESVSIQRAMILDMAEIDVRDRLQRAMDIGRPVTDWLCLGTTKDGAPVHPLARGKHRIPNDVEPKPWVFPQ